MPEAHDFLSTDAGIFTQMTYQTMQKAGLDCAAIFASIGMPDEVPDKNVRGKNALQLRFWQAAERFSGDPDIGLQIGSQMPVLRGHIMEYLFLSSPTFGEGLQRAERYSRLLSDSMVGQLRVEQDTAVLYGFQHASLHFSEFILAQILNFLRHITEGEFQPIEVRLPYREGATLAKYPKIYQCPVVFGTGQAEIRFAARLLERPSAAAEPQLLALHESLARRGIAELERYDLLVLVERALDELLKLGQANLLQVAEKLGKNPHTLKADLAKTGTTFSELLTSYQRRLAKRLLAYSQQPIEQIVELTGFSELSAFSRAFKRWTGENPSEYRRRKQRLAG